MTWKHTHAMKKCEKPTTRLNHIFLLTICLLFQSIIASAQTPIVRKQLKEVHFDSRPISKVDIREISLAPGQKGPLHKHPCPVVGYIVSGSVYFQVKGDSVIVLKAGEPFYEPADAIITHFDNASDTAPVKFIVNYLMHTEKEFIILLDDKGQQIK